MVAASHSGCGRVVTTKARTRGVRSHRAGITEPPCHLQRMAIHLKLRAADMYRSAPQRPGLDRLHGQVVGPPSLGEDSVHGPPESHLPSLRSADCAAPAHSDRQVQAGGPLAASPDRGRPGRRQGPRCRAVEDCRRPQGLCDRFSARERRQTPRCTRPTVSTAQRLALPLRAG